MELRPLGASGILVSSIGLGTVKLGRAAGVKYPTPVRIPDDAQAAYLLEFAAEMGINLIDTAPAYGTSEERLGGLLARTRDRWVICTKVGEEFDGTESRFDFSPTAVRASVERSLRRLRTDRADIVLVHSDGHAELRLEELGTLDALRDLKGRGLIRAFGVSTKSLEGALRAIRSCDCIMVTLNPDQTADLPAIDAAQKAGVGVLVKKALSSGHAADPIRAVRFALGTPGVSSVIIGTTNPEHLGCFRSPL
ncbi:MAG: aldo/keto reductase [Phycisphaerae bacterium]|nr:aldo/keto reductase [Phycisphaerae bacterium]